MTETDWQQRFGLIHERGGHILETGVWSDCKFLVGISSQRYFNAHKLVLAMASPVFDAMLYGSMQEQSDIINIPDITPESFEAMLMYIYTDKTNVNTFEEATALYYCANKYILTYLKKNCVKYLSDKMSPENVCKIYEFAKMFDEYDLTEECIQIMQTKTTDVLNDSSFIEANLNTAVDILSLTPLNIEDELVLFNAVERYTKANHDKETTYHDIVEDKKKDTNQDAQLNEEDEDSEENESTENSDTKPDVKDNETFRKLIDKVLLLTLTPEQFAVNVAKSPYIKESEAFSLLMNIASSETKLEIPQGFNTSRNPRYKLVSDPLFNRDIGTDSSPTRSRTVFRFTVPNFMQAKQMSLGFLVRNFYFRLATNPFLDRDDQKCIGIFLYCRRRRAQNFQKNYSLSTTAMISMVSNKSNTVHFLKKVDCEFTKNAQNCGWIIPMQKICDTRYGFVKDNSITIELNLTSEEPVENDE